MPSEASTMVWTAANIWSFWALVPPNTDFFFTIETDGSSAGDRDRCGVIGKFLLLRCNQLLTKMRRLVLPPDRNYILIS